MASQLVSRTAKLWQQKRTIDDVIRKLKKTYPLPTDDFFVLENIAKDYGVRICFCEAAIIPVSSYKEKTIVLPETYCSEVDIAHCAHELGHILLKTPSEAETIYFAWRIQKTGFLLDHPISLKYLALSIAETYQEYQDNPDFVEESFAPLAKSISPSLLDFAKKETYRILNGVCAAFEYHQISEEGQYKIFSRLYSVLRKIGP